MKTVKAKASALCVTLFFFIALTSCNKEETVVAGFTISSTEIYSGDVITFTNTSTNASYYQWDFGDGDLSFDENPTHKYSVVGTYEVTLTAIGDSNSDTATESITVTASYDVAIYEGAGIENVDLYDSWSDVQSTYPSTDTLHYIYDDYLEDYGFYLHKIYYYDEGLSFDFLSESYTLGSSDEVYYIWIIDPFSGATKKGISIGSDIDDAVDVYGDPETKNEEDDYTSYWYNSQGIDLYEYNSGEVDIMCIYEVYENTSLSTAKSAERKMIHERFKPILKNTIKNLKNNR